MREHGGGLRLTVVGSSPAYTLRGGNPSSCYLVEHGDDAILLDLGQGSFAALGAFREPSTVRAVFVSHLHPDHGSDLVPLRHYLRFARVPERPVELHAPPDLRRRYDILIGEDDFLGDLPGDDLAAGERLVGPFLVRIRRVTHAQDSFGFRVALADGGGAPGIAYSGDCGDPADLHDLVESGDTLLCEASFGDGPPIRDVAHLTATQAAEAARDAGAGRLLLTHILDEHDPAACVTAASRLFDSPVAVATPGLRLDIA